MVTWHLISPCWGGWRAMLRTILHLRPGTTVYTPSGRPIGVRYRVVEASTLHGSHMEAENEMVRVTAIRAYADREEGMPLQKTVNEAIGRCVLHNREMNMVDEALDVRAVRARMHLTQEAFAARFGPDRHRGSRLGAAPPAAQQCCQDAPARDRACAGRG